MYSDKVRAKQVATAMWINSIRIVYKGNFQKSITFTILNRAVSQIKVSIQVAMTMGIKIVNKVLMCLSVIQSVFRKEQPFLQSVDL